MNTLDIVIVGGGMAGLEVARRLNSEDVLILDPASTLNPEIVEERDWCEPEHDPTWWPHRNSDHPDHFSTNFGMRRRFGGRSLCWHGVALGLPEYAFDARWPSEAIDWVTDSRLPFQRHFVTLAGGLVLGDPSPLSGYAAVPKMISESASPYRFDGVYTPIDGFRANPKTVCLNSIVRDIRRHGTGFRMDVVVNGEQKTFASRQVIVGAGALHNGSFVRAFTADARPPRIYDHLVVGRSMVSSRAPAVDRQGLFFKELPASKTRVFVDLRNTDRGLEIDCWSMAADDASYVAEIVGAPDQPRVAFRDNGLEARLDTVKTVVDREFEFILESLGVTGWKLEDWSAARPTHTALLEFRSADFMTDFAICFVSALGSTDHDHGSVPFGHLDQFGELKHARGLRFVGPSSFPTLAGANPSLSTLAQARVVADAINAT